MGWTVKMNHLGDVAERLPRYIDKAVGDVADEMVAELKTTLWIDTGLVRRVTTERTIGSLSAEVVIGYNRGKGFYSRFQEWGTVKQAARPIVGPTAERFRVTLNEKMGQEIQEACDV